MPEIWFRAKRYGWGWTPVTWQGWVVLAAWVAAFAGWLLYRITSGIEAARWFLDPLTMLGVLVLITALMAVCWKKGERPRWRWGK
jgi:hypothetical protein